jgi:hypothetical protein
VPRLLERRVDLEDPLERGPGHELDLLREAAFDCRGDLASRSMRLPIDDIAEGSS